MKQFVNQKGKVVKFGDVVHYHDNVTKEGFVSFIDIHTTFTPQNLEMLKAIGAVKEVDVNQKTLEDYEKKFIAITNIGDEGFRKFKVLFPAQYLSAMITLIHDEINDSSNSTPKGYIFDISKGCMVPITVTKATPVNYINIFNSNEAKDLCLEIIKPILKVMY